MVRRVIMEVDWVIMEVLRAIMEVLRAIMEVLRAISSQDTFNVYLDMITLKNVCETMVELSI